MLRFLHLPRLLALVSFILLATQAGAQADKPAYRIFRGDGTPATYAEVLTAAGPVDVFLFGELHNNPISHWLNTELVHDLFKQKLDIVISFEQFETDQQAALDSLTKEQYTAEVFERSTRLWPNYASGYRKLVKMTTDHMLPMVAANAPRPLARLVAQKGLVALDTLPLAVRAQLAPLPLAVDTALPGYGKMQREMAGHGGSMNIGNLVEAQALKDATMAYFILQNCAPGRTVLHTTGAYHATDHSGTGVQKDGIAGYLHHYRPGVRVLTLVTVSQHNTSTLEKKYLGQADFLLVVPDTMPDTN